MKTRRTNRSRKIYPQLLVAIALATIATAQDSTEHSGRGIMVSTSALLGRSVVNDVNHERATLRELMIDPETGRIDRVVLALGGDPAQTIAVPWRMVVLASDGSLRLVATELELAQAPRMPSSPRRASAHRPRPAIDAADAPSIEISRTRPEPSSDASAREGSYVPNRSFSARFDPNSVRRFTGIVVGSVVATFEGRSDDVVLLVDVGGGERTRVHLGPKWFIDRSGFEIEPNDQISFTGSEVAVDGETIVLAVELSTNGRKLGLRTRAGHPLW